MTEILYPSGYGTLELPLDELLDKHLPVDVTEPEFRRRVRALLLARGGVLGLGDVLPRSSGHSVSTASLLNLSFHQLQKFRDGTVWACASDMVVRRPGTTHSSGAVPDGMIPVQGSAEAKVFGIHANISAPGKRGWEPWHGQCIEHDSHYAFTRLGRPRPVAGYPIPGTSPQPEGDEMTQEQYEALDAKIEAIARQVRTNDVRMDWLANTAARELLKLAKVNDVRVDAAANKRLPAMSGQLDEIAAAIAEMRDTGAVER